MKKKFQNIVVSSMLILFFSINIAFAGEIDLLVDKLVEKGILSRTEAQEIITETKEQVKAEARAAKEGKEKPPAIS